MTLKVSDRTSAEKIVTTHSIFHTIGSTMWVTGISKTKTWDGHSRK